MTEIKIQAVDGGFIIAGSLEIPPEADGGINQAIDESDMTGIDIPPPQVKKNANAKMKREAQAVALGVALDTRRAQVRAAADGMVDTLIAGCSILDLSKVSRITDQPLDGATGPETLKVSIVKGSKKAAIKERAVIHFSRQYKG